MKEEIAAAAVRASPALTVAGVEIASDWTLDDWVKIATLIYLVLQAALLVRTELRKNREAK